MKYDIIIIGAGPAGCSLALHLADTDLKILLIDKDIFPRRKVCGGALSERAVNQLKGFPENLNIYKKFIKKVQKINSYGLRVFTPKKEILEFNYRFDDKSDNVPGYICKRSDFDNFMIDEVKKCSNVSILTGIEIIDVIFRNNEVTAKSKDKIFTSKFIVGADGANSILRKKIPSFSSISDVGVSVHYNNVTGFHENNLIDMYFLNETLPGYFWIFKLPDDQVNVGIYTTKHNLKKNKLNLKTLINDVIDQNPNISKRFKNSVQVDGIKGWKMPILSKRVFSQNNLYGHRYLFVGDSASLIDPITGEGIGNALIAGNYAAQTIKKVFLNNIYDEKHLYIYRKLMRNKLKYETMIHRFARELFKNAIIIENCFLLIKKFKLINSQIARRLYKRERQ